MPTAGGAEDVALAALPVVHAHPVEGRDGLRGHQHRERPRGVLVVAGREGEALPLDELPPVRLVPHHHEQGQQLWPLLDREHLRPGLGEQAAQHIALDPARPVAAGVVEHENVGTARHAEPRGDDR